MSKCAEWIEDILGTAKQSQSPEAIQMIECCGKGCAKRKNAEEGILKLKEAASSCETRSDYAAFLSEMLPVRIEEVADGIVMYLGKENCSCPMADELANNTDMLCECTRGHEKFVWSQFFGKPVDIEIVDSFLRGGSDCVIKICID